VRPEIVAADRSFEVRRGATLWRKAGQIDEAQERSIAALHPDDRVRTTRLFRGLFFFFTWFGFSSAYGLGSAIVLGILGEPAGFSGFALLSLGTGIAVLGAAEWLHTGRRMRRFGVEEALVWIGLSNVIGGGLWLFVELLDLSTSWRLALGAWGCAGLATVAAWRWGTPATGYLAAGGLFVAVTQAPAAELVWLALAFALAWPLGHLTIAPQISPQGRKRFREAFVLVSIAAYFAIHVEIVELRLLARLGPAGFSREGLQASDWMVGASLAAMAIVPLVWLGVGLARRFRPAIDLGALMLLVSLATFAFRARPQPEWLFLALAGVGFIALALVLKRFLSARAGAEWRGLTSLPLAEDRASAGAVETLATLAAFAPGARDLEAKAFAGEGGEFGGGGASAKF
jgi:hypothetical protein